MVILTLIRRLLILLCVFGILGCLVLYLSADSKNAAKGDTDVTMGYLKLYAKSEKACSRLMDSMKATGYKTQIKSEKGNKDRLKGYVVVGNFSNELANSVAEYLKKNDYSVTIKKSPKRSDWSQCQVGKLYLKKSQAESVVKKIAKDLQVVFKTEPIYEKVATTLYFLQIENINEKTAEELKEKFSNKTEDIVWMASPQ